MLPTLPTETHTSTPISTPISTPNNDSISNNRNNKVENSNDQLHFELNILKYLSNNSTTREHINPCLEYKVLDNNVYTIFPIFNGYSLSHMQNYLSRLNHTEYYKLVFHLIKTILHGIAKIHKTHIAHQNINENSILVSSYLKPKELTVKFTDFGLGCGHISNSTSNIIGNVMDIDDYQNDKYFNIATCKTNGNVPIIISDNVMGQLSESEYLQMSQKYDLLCLGMIFLKLLLFFDNLDIDLSKGYNKLFINNVKRYIIEKYMSKREGKGRQTNRRLRQPITGEHSNIFPLLNISTEIEKDLLKYLKLLLTYVLCKTNNRKTCQYVLDKMIIYEKYKNDF
jgi:serine/threonine protein kinase